jgi:tRNA-splicing ligase RtcB (3'-phosphate/5'-hydroxy nucleic acid ligase)
MRQEIEVEEIGAYRYRIRRDQRRGMRTDVVVYANQELIDHIRTDLSLEQAMNVETLPGIIGPSLAMPDIHQGYGFPIGGVAAMAVEDGVVSPGGVGFDINCGVRLIRTTLDEVDVRPRLRDLMNQVFSDVPCGAGTTGFIKINQKQLNEVLLHGAQWDG